MATLLVVDDSVEARRAIVRALGERHQIVCAQTWAGARAAAAEQRPDIIITGIHLPDAYVMSILRVAAQIAPVILVSGYALKEDVVAALWAGAAAFVGKERLTDLPGVVRRILAVAQARRRNPPV